MIYNIVISKTPLYNLVVNGKTGLNLSIQKRAPFNVVVEKSSGNYQRKIYISPTEPPPGFLQIDDFWFQTDIEDLNLGSSSPIQSFTADGTLSILAGEVITGIVVLPSESMYGFKIGLIPGGDELVSTQDVIYTGEWISFPALYRAASSKLIYVSGISGTVQIQVIKI